MGIKALRHLALKDPELIADHQVFVVRCLESNDDSMKRITLELLYNNTNSNNIDIIVNKLIQTLVSSNDKGFRQSLTNKAFDLAVRFSRSDIWFLRVVRVLILHAPEFITSSMVNTILPIFTESCNDEPDFAKELVFTFAEMLETTDGQPSDVLMRLFSWVVANLGVPFIQNKIPNNFQRNQHMEVSKPTAVETNDLLDDMFGNDAPPTDTPQTTLPAPDQELDLLDLDFGGSPMTNTTTNPAPVSSENMDLLDDIDLLSRPNQLPQTIQTTPPVDDFDFDLLDSGNNPSNPVQPQQETLIDTQPEPEMGHVTQPVSSSTDKEVEDFLVRTSTLVIGLYNWIHKSNMTKCWILDALQQIRRLLREIGGFNDYLEEIKTVLQRDSNHVNFEVRLRVRQVLKFDVNILSLGK
jgi:hypothetical protein